jgi:hypothetical protein
MISGSSPVIANMMTTRDYIVINFRDRGINRGTCKLTRTHTLIKKNSVVACQKKNCVF